VAEKARPETETHQQSKRLDKIGHIMAKATALRVNLNLAPSTLSTPRPPAVCREESSAFERERGHFSCLATSGALLSVTFSGLPECSNFLVE